MPARRINYRRLFQADISTLALEIALDRGGQVQTSQLKNLMEQKFRPSGADARINANGEMNFRQIVANIVSNRAGARSIFSMGYARRIRGGFELTPAGIAFLDTLPR